MMESTESIPRIHKSFDDLMLITACPAYWEPRYLRNAVVLSYGEVHRDFE